MMGALVVPRLKVIIFYYNGELETSLSYIDFLRQGFTKLHRLTSKWLDSIGWLGTLSLDLASQVLQLQVQSAMLILRSFFKNI